MLNWEPRWGRLLNEILSLESDILCLQEVDFEHYESHFVPSLRQHGYKGIYKKRTNDKNDGCAIFYKDDQVNDSNSNHIRAFLVERERISRLCSLLLSENTLRNDVT